MHSHIRPTLPRWRVMLACLLSLLCAAPVLAQTEGPPAAEQPAAKPLPDNISKELGERWEQIETNRADLQELQAHIDEESVIMLQVLGRRTDQLWEETVKLSLSYCEQVADWVDKGYALDAHYQNAVQLLGEIPTGLQLAAERMRERIEMPDFSKPALEQIAIDRQLYDAARLNNRIHRALLDTCRVASRYGVDLSALRSEAQEHIEASAVNTSVYLDLSLDEVNNLRASLTVMPDDAEMKAKLRVAEIRVREVIRMLTANVDELNALGSSTTQYRRQLLTATGTVTTVSMDVHVLVRVLQDWWEGTLEFFVTNGPNYLFQALLFLAIVFLFYKLADLVRRVVDTALQARHVRLSRLMQHMIVSIARSMTIGFGVLIALSQFNISIGPMLAGLGIVGFIVGFALQDSLSNFASGLMILFYEPFDVGDSVIAGGVRGRVSSMSLVNTTIRTFDNQSLIIPNNKIWQDVITNITDQHIRRIDMQFGVSYADDIDQVEGILYGLMEADERVLKDPKPRVMVDSFGDSSVNLFCRPWVKTDDYWDVRWDLNKRVKQAFDREGVVIPFPQRDVHLYTQPSSEPKADPSPEQDL